MEGIHTEYDFKEVLALATVEREEDLDSLDLAHVLSNGFMLRGNRLLQAVGALAELGFQDVTGVLVRPVVENVVTAFWLLDAPAERLPVLLGDHRLYLRRMKTWYPSRETRFDATYFDKYMTSIVGHCESRTLPEMKERAGPSWQAWQPIFKAMSAELHSSVTSSWKQFFQLQGGILILESFEDQLPEQPIAEAAYLLLTLAKRIHDDLKWGSVDIDELLEDLASWNPDRTEASNE